MIRVEVDGLDAVVSGFDQAPRRVSDEVYKVTEVAANKIKNDLRNEAQGVTYAPHFPRSITYDMHTGLMSGTTEAEIGPYEGGPQWGLGNILYFGTSNNSPRLPPPDGALEREVPQWLRHLREALDKGIG
jgi:hypothetical protein